MKTVALFGGSFNPPHLGHFEMAKFIHETLKTDEVWFLFSVNWQKNPAHYASPNHRMEMGNILAKEFSDCPFVMSNIQEDLKTHDTYDVLQALKERYPDTRFIWIMGADNLNSFHTWKNADLIMEQHAIAVLQRPPYTQQSLLSQTALSYAHLKTQNPLDLRSGDSGWSMLNNPEIDLSSSALLQNLNRDIESIDARYEAVIEYMKQHKLYAFKEENDSSPQFTTRNFG